MTCDYTMRQYKAARENLLAELMDKSEDGSTATVAVNILRNWPRAKIERFALHLLGDSYKEEWQGQ